MAAESLMDPLNGLPGRHLWQSGRRSPTLHRLVTRFEPVGVGLVRRHSAHLLLCCHRRTGSALAKSRATWRRRPHWPRTLLMARWPRLVVPGLPLHVVQRGNNRTLTFHSDEDFACLRATLLYASRRSGCRVHAYALMPNHVHLLVTPEDTRGPSRLMQIVGRRYVRYFNARYARTGTLWEGRFRSSLVDSDNYLLACCRYIDRNPVKAGIVDEPTQYRWSSYRHLALGHADPLISPHAVYTALGATPESRQASYRALCENEVAPPLLFMIRSCTTGGGAMGSEDFRAQMEAILRRRVVRLPHGGDRRSAVATSRSAG